MFAAVESDVVGYTTIEMQAGKWYQIGNPFVGLDGETSSTLNEVFVDGFGNGDIAYVFDSSTNAYGACYFNVATTSGRIWSDMPIAGIGQPADVTLSPGQAIYVWKESAGKVTFKGKVQAVPTSFGDEEFAQTWAQVAVVSPADSAINDYEWVGLGNGDTLYLLNSETGEYDTCLYWQPTKNAWCNNPVAVIATPVDLVIKAGQAMYIYKASKGKAHVLDPRLPSATVSQN